MARDGLRLGSMNAESTMTMKTPANALRPAYGSMSVTVASICNTKIYTLTEWATDRPPDGSTARIRLGTYRHR